MMNSIREFTPQATCLGHDLRMISYVIARKYKSGDSSKGGLIAQIPLSSPLSMGAYAHNPKATFTPSITMLVPMMAMMSPMILPITVMTLLPTRLTIRSLMLKAA